MAEAIAFYFIAACILGFAVLVVSTRDTVHSVLFLVLCALCAASVRSVFQIPVSSVPHRQGLQGLAIAEVAGDLVSRGAQGWHMALIDLRRRAR